MDRATGKLHVMNVAEYVSTNAGHVRCKKKLVDGSFMYYIQYYDGINLTSKVC